MHMHRNMSLNTRTLNKYLKAVNAFFMRYNSLLNAVRVKKCVLKLLIYVPLYLTLFMINMCDKAISDHPFLLKYYINRYKTQ